MIEFVTITIRKGTNIPAHSIMQSRLQCNIMVIRKKPWDNTKNRYVYLKKIKDCAIA
ncbi:MAG TPA: hypothetical protein PK125_11660 [Syntrophorhabdus sp.]|nr:hypothetical protein [Syntrophorhabdus sp.]